MKIVFEITEQLENIVEEIMNSAKWITTVKEKINGKTIVVIRDRQYNSEATIEILDHSLMIRTAWSRYTYRIYEDHGKVMCEYNGAYRGLLEQNLLPTIVPKESLLDTEVLESSLTNGERKKLREYAALNVQQKRNHHEYYNEGQRGVASFDHPRLVHDEFIKEDYIGPQL